MIPTHAARARARYTTFPFSCVPLPLKTSWASGFQLLARRSSSFHGYWLMRLLSVLRSFIIGNTENWYETRSCLHMCVSKYCQYNNRAESTRNENTFLRWIVKMSARDEVISITASITQKQIFTRNESENDWWRLISLLHMRIHVMCIRNDIVFVLTNGICAKFSYRL